MRSNTTVKEVNATELTTRGTKHGNAIILSNNALPSKFSLDEMIPPSTMVEMHITIPRWDSIGDAYVMQNIRIPERTVE